MKTLDVELGQNVIIPLGIQGENRARRIQFNFSRWKQLYGMGILDLLVRRPKDIEPRSVPIEVEGNIGVWTVRDTDTAHAGTGFCELQYYTDNALVKSQTCVTKVQPSLDGLFGISDSDVATDEEVNEMLSEIFS